MCRVTSGSSVHGRRRNKYKLRGSRSSMMGIPIPSLGYKPQEVSGTDDSSRVAHLSS